tara:strand:- start:1218 stop:1778 length:561 start_codon:yes stop_codon:yes gene_type:complete
MNQLIYTENNNLHITKPNGLRYEYKNVEKPNLGFEFDVIIYDMQEGEYKIVNYNDDLPFNEQEKSVLEDSERDAIEEFINQSEPPNGMCLNNQFMSDIENVTRDRINACADCYRFENLNECVYAGREGSNHPFRSEARRVLEFADAIWTVCFQTQEEINATREDHLKPFEEYMHVLPEPIGPDSIS